MTNTVNYKDNVFSVIFFEILEEFPSQIKHYCYNKFDPNITSSDGMNLLMALTSDGDLARAEKLIECGINIHHKNTYGNTALHIGAFGDHCEIVDMLISNNVNPLTANNAGSTACDILIDHNVCSNAISHCNSKQENLSGVVVYENHNDTFSSAW